MIQYPAMWNVFSWKLHHRWPTANERARYMKAGSLQRCPRPEYQLNYLSTSNSLCKTHNPCSRVCPTMSPSIIFFLFFAGLQASCGLLFLTTIPVSHMIIFLSLLACVWLWGVVCGPDIVVDDFSYCKIMRCVTPCRQSVMQCAHSRHAVWKEQWSDSFENHAMWTRHKEVGPQQNDS